MTIKNILEGKNYIENDTSIITTDGLDFYIPDHKLAIGVDKIYHNTELSGRKSKNYHTEKTEKCIEQDVKLIHVWDNEIADKWPIVASRIRAQLNMNQRVFARKCQIVQLSSQENRFFFNQYHLQGYGLSSICYGLVHNGDLVTAMSFGKSRFNKNIEYEIIRAATCFGSTVVGGPSKLFSHFVKTHTPKSVITYADRRWGEGHSYLNLGFTFSHSSNPNYFYTKDYRKLHSRNEFQKHKLKDKLATFNPALTEWDNMTSNGWDRIWDCGNNVYHWTPK